MVVYDILSSRRVQGPSGARLLNGPGNGLDLAVAAARTCYSGRGLVPPERIAGGAGSEEEARLARIRRDSLARDLYQAGHHTTFQHAHYIFALENVSRLALWSFLHSHPFYNSEQVSQRYVPMDRLGHYRPGLEPPAAAVYEETVETLVRGYLELSRSLVPLAEHAFFERFPARRSQPDRWRKEIAKRAQEAARAVLPVATLAYLYHTVSALTLYRYHRICGLYDVPAEQRELVQAMVAAVRAQDPDYDRLLEDPLPLEETPEFQALTALAAGRPHAGFRERFDRSLEGRVSKLVSFNPDAEAIVAESVREMLGASPQEIPDEDALALVLDPAKNRLLGESLNLGVHSKLFRALSHAHYTFRKKLSLAADSQDQRHRMTPASRPILAAQIDEAPDVVLPRLLELDDSLALRFGELCNRAWEGMARLRKLGVGAEQFLYLLPNAAAVRFTESGNLLFLHHKFTMRLCWNAQEEIWRASVEEVEQIRAVHPRLGRWLLAPCEQRFQAGVKPPCPEGARYCGVPLWRETCERPVRVF